LLASAYDLNGNLTAQTVNGQTTRFTWDDEDRLASTTLPDGHTDGNACTGLGMRLSKTDGGVGYAYLCDGVSPASPVLSDGQLSFTPGISQTLGTPNGSGGMSYASHFYAEDAVGNLRGMSDGGAQGFPDAYNWDAFGQLIGRAGGTSTPFGYGEASGYQADGDTGLRLLGHRYYDSRTGRFISQDPIGDGTNWYAYCDNNPVSHTDPLGLVCPDFDSTGMTSSQIYDHVTSHGGLVGEEYQTVGKNGNVLSAFTVAGFSYGGVSIVAPQGSNINRDISRARQFYASKDSQSQYASGWHGMNKVWRHDPDKIGQYLIDNYGPGTTGDPKTKGKQYDKYGHAIYAAVGSELRLTYGTILDGEVGVHNLVHPLSPGEQENGEFAGWSFDQKHHNPGPGIYTDSDFVDSAASFIWHNKFGF